MEKSQLLHLIVNEAIELRLPVAKDAVPFFALIQRNRAYLRKYLSWVDWHKSIEETYRFFFFVHEGFYDKRRYNPLIFYRGHVAGTVSLFDVDMVNDKAEIGYWLGEEYTGKGIMTQAARRLLRFGFHNLRLNRVILRAAVGNQPSIAVAKRLGFTFEGILRQDKMLHGRYIDMELYSLLASEFTLAED
ncbi:MAG: N-acetyltransferase [Chloroflexi bacterium]|nr:MAG: N-acetyltransferase [Chloroflexota bacterium]